MKLSKIVSAVVLVAAITFSACKGTPSDAEIQKAIDAKIQSTAEMTGVKVAVDKGVVTMTGECKDEACKKMCQEVIGGMSGVKSVVNNAGIAAPPPPPPASMTTTLDAAVMQKVKDGLKDIKGVTVEFAGDKAVLSGEVSKADRMKIMQMLGSAKVLSDVTKLLDKK
jgi:hyperosmotically inducible periplasmic protein